MRPAKEIIGKPIYSAIDGRLLGTVRDLYLDADLRTVTGIFVGSEGLFSRKARLIPSDKVSVLGVDAVLATESDVIKDDSEFVPGQEWLRRDSLQGRIMHTAGGTKVGSVGDVLLDDEAKVVAFSLARVNVEGPIARNRVVTRAAVIDGGGLEGTMIIDLAKAERPPAGPVGGRTQVEVEADKHPAQSEDAVDPGPEDEIAE